MAKESHKQSPRSRKENSGCIGGFFSMFDFRQGCYMPRLPSDSKLGDVRNSGFGCSRGKDDVSRNKEKNHKEAKNMASSSVIENDEEARKVNLGVASIKTLLEEEMSRKQQSWNEYNPKNDWLKAGVGFEANADNSLKEQTVVVSDGPSNELKVYTRLISHLSDYSNRSGMLSSDLDVAAFLEDYCSTLFLVKDDQSEFNNRTSQCSSPVNIEELKKSENADESATILQKAIIDIAKALLKQKSINSSKLVEKTEAQQEEFRNALEMLNSNKDLFLMFLHDPDSPIRKHIQDPENIHVGKSSNISKKQTFAKISDSKQLHKGSCPYFVRKKEKIAEENHSNELSDDTANRIFVLKPNSVSKQNHSNTVSMASSVQSHHGPKNKEDVDGEKISYHFSLEDIKRRFKNAVGATQKARRSIAMDGILHKVPYGKQTSSESENSSRRHAFERGDKKKSNAKEIEKKSEFSCSSNFFRERKKSSKNATPQKMYREAALYGESKKNISESVQMDRKSKSLPDNQASKYLGRMLSLSEYNNLSSRLSPAREKAPESPLEKASAFPFHVHQNFDANYLIPQNPEESFPNTDKSQKTKNGSMEIIEDKFCIQFEEGSELDASFEAISNEDDLPSESFKEEASSILLKPFEEMFQPSTPLTLMDSSSTVVAQEPRDTECSMESTRRPSPISVLEPHYFEDNSPTSMIRENESFAERKSVEKEPQIGSNPSSTTCMDFDEASLFDELEQSYGLSIDDPKLLFDLIDEVVGEIKERHRTFLWQRRSATPSLKQRDFYKQASKRIDWHLDVQFPITVEQAAKKDIEGVAWFDSHLHLEAENVVNEVGNAILNYLFEEMALELWD